MCSFDKPDCFNCPFPDCTATVGDIKRQWKSNRVYKKAKLVTAEDRKRYQHEYYLAHKAERSRYKAEWRKSHREECREYDRNYRERKKQEAGA